jgi:cathepsin L
LIRMAAFQLLLSFALFFAAISSLENVRPKPIGSRWHQLQDYTFDKYCQEHGKSYKTEERKMRQRIFEERLAAIKLHNADSSKSWKQGVNKLTDRTEKELKGLYQGSLPNVNRKVTMATRKVKGLSLPTSVDWRNKGIISNVKDQGRCGSCWSFASTENVESYYALKYNNLPVLSEQQILDCTPNPMECGGTGGCGGGTVELAYQRIQVMGGLSSEWTYPYTSYYGDNSQCNMSRFSPVAQLTGYVNLPSNENGMVLSHLATTGPLAITIDASDWSLYEEGVFDGCNQTNPDLDHGVQLVGYGTDSAHGDYWLVRNSWSPQWGENGYIRIRRTKTPRCGLDLKPLDGDACKNETAPIVVCGTCGILYDCLYPVIQ